MGLAFAAMVERGRVDLLLEIYFEDDSDRALAERSRADLKRIVRDLAPWIALSVDLMKASNTPQTDVGGRNVPYHPPSAASHQSLLITSEPIGADGWGWPPSCVVSRQKLEWKTANGGDPADLLVHEWIHTLYGIEINGRAVPNPDSEQGFGFPPVKGGDGEDTWHDWYRYALGG
jgi:hypothetical protein